MGFYGFFLDFMGFTDVVSGNLLDFANLKIAQPERCEFSRGVDVSHQFLVDVYQGVHPGTKSALSSDE